MSLKCWRKRQTNKGYNTNLKAGQIVIFCLFGYFWVFSCNLSLMSHREEKLGWIYLNICDLFFYSSVSVPAAKKPLDTQNVIKNGSAD